MSIRSKWTTAAPLVALLAAACTDDVTQEQNPTFLRASFNSETGAIPRPNDLVLQGAYRLPAGATRTGLMGLIGLGGFFANPQAAPPLSLASVIDIPYEVVGPEGLGTTTGATGIDPASVTTRTLAILRVNGGGPPTAFDPIVVGTGQGHLQAVPSPGGYVAGGRYVVALRGGPNGVKTFDGRTIEPSSAVYLITHRVNLKSKETRPATLTDQQAADLDKVQALMLAPVDWAQLASSTACAAVNSTTSDRFPENRCWVPLVPGVPGAPGTPPSSGALTAVDAVFPVTEAASIQTFEIQP